MSDEEVAVVPAQGDDAQDATETALTTTSTEVAAPAERKVKKIIRKKRRPARPQVDPSFITSEPPPQTGTIFNIWYALSPFSLVTPKGASLTCTL
ncbi:hypothetical protein VDGD_20316 [Verticillium dahliae]|nr:hypothetical protein VDGD_20316 [Verticillium dahliae]